LLLTVSHSSISKQFFVCHNDQRDIYPVQARIRICSMCVSELSAGDTGRVSGSLRSFVSFDHDLHGVDTFVFSSVCGLISVFG